MPVRNVPAPPNATGTQAWTSCALAVTAEPRIAAAPVSPSERRRAAPLITSSSSAPRKCTCSFWPGRAPVTRSNASTSRIARTRSFWPS